MNGSNPKVSVIVAVYNAEAYLRRCLNSIISQTFREIEIILIDDGSTDNSSSICDEYATDDLRIRVIHQDNKGFASARNSGMISARGEYICFIDADDWVEPNLVSDNYAFVKRNACDIVFFGYTKEVKRVKGVCRLKRIPPALKIMSAQDLKRDLSSIFEAGCGFSVWQQFIRADFIRENNLSFSTDLRRLADIYFLFDLYSKYPSIATNQGTYYHQCTFASRAKASPDAFELHKICFRKFLAISSDWLSFRNNYVFSARLFSLWFSYVIPNMIISSKDLSYRERLNKFNKILADPEVKGWLGVFKTSTPDNLVASVLICILKLKSPTIFYWFAYMHKMLRDYLVFPYSCFFYKKANLKDYSNE